MTLKKRLIEYDLPLAEISEASARESEDKSGRINSLHKWWARRPLAAGRASTFAALVDDPGPDEPQKREELLKLVMEMASWEAVKNGNNSDIDNAQQMIREQFGYVPKVLDPFSGGGSIPLEMLRLGCEVYSSDYNPVAVLIEKATLEWPQKFGYMVGKRKLEQILNSINYQVKVTHSDKPIQATFLDKDDEQINLLAGLVEYWANIVLKDAEAEIGQFYRVKEEEWIPVGYLWARTIQCGNPTCGAEIPLTRTYWLAKKSDKSIAYIPKVDKDNRTVTFRIISGHNIEKTVESYPLTVARGNSRCLVCGQTMSAKKLRELGVNGLMGERMLAVVLHNVNSPGKKYRIATDEDKEIYEATRNFLDKTLIEWDDLLRPLPTDEIPLMSGTFNVPLYGYDRWDKLLL